MNAHAFERIDTDRWAHIRAVAAAIGDADLYDETDVVRALYATRMTAKDFMDVLDAGIELAREEKQ